MNKNNTDVLTPAAADDVGHDATGADDDNAMAWEQMMPMMILVMMLLMLQAREPIMHMMMLRAANILATNVLNYQLSKYGNKRRTRKKQTPSNQPTPSSKPNKSTTDTQQITINFCMVNTGNLETQWKESPCLEQLFLL